MVFLSPAVKCLLSGSCLRGTGRWCVLVCYWLVCVCCAGSAALLLAVSKGTEVICGDLWSAPVLTGQLQNREDQTWYELRHIHFLSGQTATNISRCVRALPMRADTQTHTHLLFVLQEMLQSRRYQQCFVFVLSQDLVIGFQSIPTNNYKRKVKASVSVHHWKQNTQFQITVHKHNLDSVYVNKHCRQYACAAKWIVPSYVKCDYWSHSVIKSKAEA